jgi:hypothetical protein
MGIGDKIKIRQRVQNLDYLHILNGKEGLKKEL